MDEDITDSHFLTMLAHWIETMHKLGRFNSSDCEHAQAAMDELTGRILKIAGKLSFLEKKMREMRISDLDQN